MGGRRIELGEIDSALLALHGVHAAAAAVRRTATGNQVLVGDVVTDEEFEVARSMERLRDGLPRGLVPRLARSTTYRRRRPARSTATRSPAVARPGRPAVDHLDETAGWIASIWRDVLGAPATSLADDFFDQGGGSLTAAQTVSLLRRRYPEVAIGDIYDHPTIGTLAEYLDGLARGEDAVRDRSVPPTPFKTQAGQVVATTVLRMAAAPRWLAWMLLVTGASELLGLDGLPTVSWWWLGLAVLVVLTPPGRMLLAAAGARLLLRGVGPGNYPRGGRVHLQLWAAERLADQLGALNLAGAPYITWYARLLGARVGKDVDLHSIPPVTGLLRLGPGCSVEPEVDLSGYWIDGDLLRVGEVSVGRTRAHRYAQHAVPRRHGRRRRRGRRRIGSLRGRPG